MESNNEPLRQAIELLLDLPNIQVQAAHQDLKVNYIVTLVSTERGTTCHKCHKRIDKSNGYGEWVTLRHTPIFNKAVYLRIRLPRCQCDCDGQPTTTQQVSWFARRSPFTKAYEAHLLLACVNSTIADVSIKENVTYDAIRGVLDRNIRKSVDWSTIEPFEVIGIDEISIKKGHQDFVGIVTARRGDETHILGVLEDRKKETIIRFFRSIPKRLRRTIRYVCSDMYDGFINAAKEVFGRKVRIVADRFHVAKLYREGLEDLRKKELRRLKRELPAATYKKFKGVMWSLRKKEEDLTEDDRAALEQLFQYSPRLKQAYLYRDQLTAIFDRQVTRAQAKHLLNAWMDRITRSDIRCFDGFIKTLIARKDEITNYFVGRHNSGFVEGLNNKIKVIKRRCYGILNPEHLFQRIHLDLVGYKLYA
jgi:transposase